MTATTGLFIGNTYGDYQVFLSHKNVNFLQKLISEDRNKHQLLHMYSSEAIEKSGHLRLGA